MIHHQENKLMGWFRKGYHHLVPLQTRFYWRNLRIVLLNSFGASPYACPVCGAHFRKFALFKPSPSRPGRPALCPFCYSLERTRTLWLYLQMHQLLEGHISILHVAPEPGLERMLRKKENITYVSTDLMMKNGVDAHASLTDLPLVSSLFDLIYCSNVLEHINDDLNAMAELQRVLKPGGLAIIQVPIEGETTFEDPTITSSEDRDKYFGQADHVRYYGRDIRCRLEQAGFLVEECWMPAALGLAEDQLLRYGVNKKELIHLCRKLQ